MKKHIFTFFFIFLCVIAHAQTKDIGITFEFENGEVITENSQEYYSFDIVAYGSNDDSYFGSGMVYLCYSTDSFGENVCYADNIIVEKGQLVNGDLAPGVPLYEIVNVTDNTPSCVAITTCYGFPTAPNQANVLSATPIQYLHIKLKIIDITGYSELSFNESLMIGQQYQSNHINKYIPVVATDTDDFDLPISEPEVENPSSDTRILQCSPNPIDFNSSNTLLSIVSPKEGLLRLAVYNIKGQLITTLFKQIVHKNQEIELSWNGKDSNNNILPTGIYFYQLIMNREICKTLKFLITR